MLYATPRNGVKLMEKKQNIKTVSYVHVGDKLVNTKDLNDEQRLRLATWLKITYLNALFEGEATFFCSDEKDCCPGCTVKCPHNDKGPGE